MRINKTKSKNKEENLPIIIKKDPSKIIEKYRNKIFYKERWIKENNLEQRLIITYSVKYQEYQKNIRNNQINRAKMAPIFQITLEVI